MNKYIPLNPFPTVGPVIPPLLVGRETELRLLTDLIEKGEGNAIIYGARGIGKTSILLTLQEVLKSYHRKTLVLHTSSMAFHQNIESFAADLTLQICQCIWTKVFKYKYSDLLSESILYPRSKLSTDAESTIRRIVQIVTGREIISKGTIDQKAGIKVIADLGVSSNSEVQFSRAPLKSFEFIELVSELRSIIEESDFERLVICIDEFNYLPESERQEFLQGFFEILSSKKIQFILSGFSINSTNSPLPIQVFSQEILVKPFNSSQQVSSLISICFKLFQEEGGSIKASFSPDAFEKIVEVSKGHPLCIQQICYRSYENSQKNIIDSDDIELIGKELEYRNALFLESMEYFQKRI